MTTTFKIDTSDYLSIDYNAFRDDMLELALAKPSDYFKLRKRVLQTVKKDAVENIYTTYYNLLTEGLDKDGNAIINAAWQPRYPKQLVNQFALGASKTIDKIAEEAVEIILPRNYKDIANERTSTKGKAGMIE
jgi:hypothetical protein